MTQAFRTAHKCLTYYVDIPETQGIAETYGSHLQHLTQLQKYKIITSLSMWLWCLTEDELVEDLEPEEEEEVDDFVESFFEPTQGQIAEFFDESYPQQLSDAARTVLNTLDFVDPEHLANLLPAIALYAAEDGHR
jgi:hypothetical protein